MSMAHYLIDDPVARKLRVNPNGSLLDPEYLIVLASATQLNILTRQRKSSRTLIRLSMKNCGAQTARRSRSFTRKCLSKRR